VNPSLGDLLKGESGLWNKSDHLLTGVWNLLGMTELSLPAIAESDKENLNCGRRPGEDYLF